MALCEVFALFWCILRLYSPVLASDFQHCSTADGVCVDAAAVRKPAVFQHDPGFRAIITRRGLSYLNTLLIPLLKREITKLEIPDISGEADITIGEVEYKFKRIHLTEVTIGSSSLQSDSEKGLALMMDDVSMRVEADWSYKLILSDKGSVRMKANGVSLAVSILLGATGKGQPSLLSTSCAFKAGDISVKFKGGASWLLNLFTRFVEGRIKDALNSKVCSLASSSIKGAIDSSLASFPVIFKVNDVLRLSYALLKPPKFVSGIVMTDHKGEFFSESQSNTDIPFSPSPLPSVPPVPESSWRMMYLWVTDYVANSAALVYTRTSSLHYNITPNMVGGSESFLKLDTNLFSHLIPRFYDAYPNQPVVLGVRSTDSPPSTTITVQGARLTLPGAMDFYVGNEGDTTLAFSIRMVVSLDVHPWIEKSKDNQFLIKANATYSDAELTIPISNIRDIGEKAIANVKSAVEVLCKMFLMPPINRFTSTGFPIPMVDGMTFVNPTLSLGEGYAMVETDMEQSR